MEGTSSSVVGGRAAVAIERDSLRLARRDDGDRVNKNADGIEMGGSSGGDFGMLMLCLYIFV
jgi:hypothetical protein